jgi:hypothetical protein
MTAMSQRSGFKAADSYGLELHPSGLAVYITGKHHRTLAPIASAIVEDEAAAKPVAAAAKKASR